ncbi:thiamine diphosphokinase [Sulfitobacter sp. S190]|uniref:thiamine diphosphokinase n=1 Tax=Sulfitobacter sp. S190 TaxID=2867022 RepID=UPI0021A4D09C|nr:thiamine diphosphokinase [Sulfitobacter sp. S190]UWR21432.1 thiamine diphosphokinase [Sulfitobacter sp. S190]
MSDPIVHDSAPVTLVGGGQASVRDVEEALIHAPLLVAVDGGVSLALAAGHLPHAVIGDMDSAPPEALAQIPSDRQHRISEQQSTDFDKALRNTRAPVVIGVGFLGARIDHQMAAMTVLVRRADRACVLLGEHEIVLACPPHLHLDTRAGEPVSLYPLSPVRGRSEGLNWPIDGIDFAPDGTVGTSNHALGPVELWMDGPGMLVIVPRRCLEQVVGFLAAQGQSWSARPQT